MMRFSDELREKAADQLAARSRYCASLAAFSGLRRNGSIRSMAAACAVAAALRTQPFTFDCQLFGRQMPDWM